MGEDTGVYTGEDMGEDTVLDNEPSWPFGEVG